MRDGGLSALCHSCGFACQQRMLKTFPGSGYLHSEDGVVWLWHPLVCLYIWLTISSCYGSTPLALVLIGKDGGLSTLCGSCGFARQERVLKTFPCSGYLHSEDMLVWLWHPLDYLYVWVTISSCYGSILLALGLIRRDCGLSTVCDSCGFPCQQRVLKSIPGPGYFNSDYGVVWLWHPLVNLYIWLTISSCSGSIALALVLIGKDGGLSTLCHSWGLACQQKVLKTFPGSGYLHSQNGVVWLWHRLVNLYLWLTISSCYRWIPLALVLIVRDGGLSTLCHSCGLACPQNVLKTFPGSGCVDSVDGVVWPWHPVVNLYASLTISSCCDSIRLALDLIVRDGGLSTLCHGWGFACQQRVLKMFPGSGYVHSEDRVVWLWHPLEYLYVWLTISFCFGSIPLALGLIVRDGGLSTLCDNSGFACQQRVLETFRGLGSLHSDDAVVFVWHRMVNLYIWLTTSSCYGSITLALVLIWKDTALSILCHSCGFACQQRVLKTFPGSGYLQSEDGVVWLWHPLEYLYLWLTISSCYGSISLTLGLIVRDGGLSTICHSCGFSCQQKVLETFSGLGFLQADNGVVWLWHPLVNLYVWLTISSCYGSISLAWVFIGRDGGLSTLRHSCGFACHQKVLKTFPGSGYLHSEDEVVSLWHPLVNLYVWLNPFGLRLDSEGWWFEHSMS